MEEKIVTLIQEVPAQGLFYRDAPIDNWLSSFSDEPFNGWINVNTLPGSGGIAQNKIWAFQDTIDVSGWGNQGLTFYPLQAGVQEGNMWTYINNDLLQVIDIISDSPLDLARFCSINLTQLPFRTVPGLYQRTPPGPDVKNPPLGFENILYGQSRTMGYNSNFPTSGGIPYVMPININEFGSMNPTASDKLYITRILVCDNALNQTGFMNAPSSRFMIKGQLKRESDLSYVYRLKDSFKTAQTDVGYGDL